jgi:hypothetical protein
MLSDIRLSIIKLNVAMLCAIRLSVIIPNVVASGVLYEV